MSDGVGRLRANQSQIRRRIGAVAAVLAAVLLVQAAAVAADGRARATRPGGRRPAVGTASGHAHFGHGRPGSGSHHSHFWHPSYLHLGWAYPWYWGAPYYYAGYWGYPAPYGPGWERPYSLRGEAAIETDVKPRRAAVALDGELVGQARDFNGTWDVLWVEPGEHTIEFTAPGWMTLRRPVRVRAGGTLRIVEELGRGDGIDPRSVAETRASAADEPGPAIEPYERSDDEREDVPRRTSGPAIERGFLRLEVWPEDAVVYLDGDFLARADELAGLHGALPVAVGPHTIEVVRPGYRSQRSEVEVGSAEAAHVTVRLERAP